MASTCRNNFHKEFHNGVQLAENCFLGDSYCAGAGASSQTKRWTTIAAKSLHWEEFNLCLGANEYFFPSSDTGEKVCGAATCVDYAAQISDAVATKPNVVIISGDEIAWGWLQQTETSSRRRYAPFSIRFENHYRKQRSLR